MDLGQQVSNLTAVRPTLPSSRQVKILVSVWPGLGDVVFATPVFRILRKKFPDAKIAVLTQSKGGKELLSHTPYIDEIVYSPLLSIPALVLKFKGYDIGLQCSGPIQLFFILCRIKKRVSFSGNPFWWLYPVSDNNYHSTEYYLRAVDKIDGVKLRDTNGCELFIGEKGKRFAQAMLKNIPHPIVAVHPGARCNKNKQWGAKNLVKLCNSIIEKFNAQILLIGGKSDVKLCNYIQNHIHTKALNLAGMTTLLQSAAIIEECDLFIGHASGPTHIAAALGTPVVAIYGADNPKNFAPLGRSVIVVTPKLRCAPCFHFYRNFLWGLRLRYIPVCKAIQTIKVEDVFNACAQVLKNEEKERK
ncbi:MAG: glycosyltransferase family 9 protein [bacterium]|nr:glycosyltransferase family 9 protein [bacterium]